VRPVVADPGGGAARVEQWLARAKCSVCRTSFACYPDALYPRRQFQLDVVASVVAKVSVGEDTIAAAAQGAGASPTSARRWMRWVAALAEPSVLLRATVQIDPSAPVGVGISRHGGDGVRVRVARVLDALEQLGAALVRRGIALAMCSGLGRVLGWQRSLFGDVVGLVAEPKTLSPGMALGGAPNGR
jgi:hypothetical protein